MKPSARTFFSLFTEFLKLESKTKKVLSGNDEQVVRKCVTALDGSDLYKAEAAAEKLGLLGENICLPGIRKALQMEHLSRRVLRGLGQAHYHGNPESGWREAIYPLLLESATSQHPDPSVPRDAAILAMTLNPCDATGKILEATSCPDRAVLIDIHQTTRFNLPDDQLGALGIALIPHAGDLRLGPFLDYIVTRLAVSNWEGGPPELRTLITEERGRHGTGALEFRTPSRAFLRLDKCGEPATIKVHALHQTLDDRFHRKGIEVGFNNDRLEELKHMSEQEWVTRTLNCFFCSCENSGRLSWESERGLPLLPELEEVGLIGCVKALRAIAILEDQEQDVWKREGAGDLGEEAAAKEVELIQEAKEKAEFEAEAEGFEACATALWNYAVKHQLEILQDS